LYTINALIAYKLIAKKVVGNLGGVYIKDKVKLVRSEISYLCPQKYK